MKQPRVASPFAFRKAALDRSIAVVGLQRSGTNFLQTFVRRAVGSDKVVNTYWKHHFPSIIEIEEIQKYHIALITRHPATWLQSCLQHNPADLFTAHGRFFEQGDAVAAMAQLYSSFHSDWLECIAANGGVHIQYEDALLAYVNESESAAPNAGATAMSEAGGEGRIDHVKYSLPMSEQDREDAIRIRCGLEGDVVDHFFNVVDRDLLDRLGYSAEQIEFTSSESVRSIAYRALKAPLSLNQHQVARIAAADPAMFENTPAVNYALGLAFAQFGETDRAADCFSRALLAVDPFDEHHDTDVEDRLSEFELKLLKMDARRALAALARKRPDGFQGLDLGDLDEADAADMADLAAAVDRAVVEFLANSESVEFVARCHAFAAQLHARRGETAEAIARYQQACNLFPLVGAFWGSLGGLMLAEDRFDEAAEALKVALRLEPKVASYNAQMGAVLMAVGQTREALHFLKIATDSPDAVAGDHYHHGRLAFEMGLWQEAERSLRRAAELAPGDAEVHDSLGMALEQLGDAVGALQHSAMACASPGAEYWHHHRHGGLLAQAGRPEEAMAAFRRAIELAPEHAAHRFALGEVLEQLGEAAEALRAFEGACACQDALCSHHHRLGWMLAEAGRPAEAEGFLRRAVAMEANCAEHHHALSQVLERLGRADEAIVQAELASACPDAWAWHHHRLGRMLASVGRLGEARDSLLRAADLAPDRAPIRDILSQVSERLGDIDEALRQQDIACACPGATADHHYRLGWLLAQSERPTDAAVSLRRAMDVGPPVAEHHDLLSKVLESLGDMEGALHHAEAACASSDPQASRYLRLGSLLPQLGRPADAVPALLKAVALEPNSAEHHHALSLTLEHLGRSSEAMRHAEAMTACLDATASHHYRLGRLLAGEGRLEEAIPPLRRAVEMAPECAGYHHALGQVLAQTNRLAEAAESLQSAIGIEPDCADHHDLLSHVLEGLGDPQGALRQAEAASACCDAHAMRLLRLGWLLGQVARPAEAVAHLSRVVELEPNIAEPHNILSQVLQDMGEASDAIVQAEAACACPDANAEHWNRLGWLLAEAGRLTEAEAGFRRALEMAPDTVEYQKALGQVYERLEQRKPFYKTRKWIMRWGRPFRTGWNWTTTRLALRQGARRRPSEGDYRPLA